MNKRTLGNEKEDRACSFLQSKGVTILERNFNSRQGEIDIIGRDGEYLVFFEVKYRSSADYGNPLEAVTLYKQRRIIKASRYYMYIRHISEDSFIRFDVIGILDSDILWIKDAFSGYSY